MCNLVFYIFQGVFLFIIIFIIQNCGYYDKYKKVKIDENINNINIQQEKIINNGENKEIKQLKEELTKSKIIINQLNIKINELENKLQIENNKYINKIKELENNIIQKNNELNQLKAKLLDNNIIQNKDKSVSFISSDQSIFFSVPCSGNSTFAEVEELLYREYPDLRETNNIFFANGKQILRFKTINENNAGTGRPVMLIKPVE